MTETLTATPQWKRRVKVFEFIYGSLVSGDQTSEAKKKAFEDFVFDDWQTKLIETYADHRDEYIQAIGGALKQDWTFERLPYTDQAILLLGLAEHAAFATHPGVIIEQAVITAKNYSEEESYRYINAALQKILGAKK